MLRGTDKCVRPNTEKAAHFKNRTKVSKWETLAQRRTIARLRALFKAYSEERAWKLHVTRCEGITILSI